MIETAILVTAAGIGITALIIAAIGAQKYFEINNEIRVKDQNHELKGFQQILGDVGNKKHIELGRNKYGHFQLIASDRDNPPQHITPTIVPPAPPHYQPPILYSGMRIDPGDKYHATYRDS